MKKLNGFITTVAGFQYSVNLRYDLGKENKVQGYIPLVQSSEILKEIILANNPEETSRSRILIGAYGTGKSHLTLVALSALGQLLPFESYKPLIRRMFQTCPEAADILTGCVDESSPKMLPVIIDGNGADLDQVLLVSLKRALQDYGMTELMPLTVYQAARDQLIEWRDQYPKAYRAMDDFVAETYRKNIDQLATSLEKMDKEAYSMFQEGYREVTHGASFEPLLRGRPEDVYQEISSLLPAEYRGILVVFDEFGKYLENAWEQEKSLDLKPLQDFAEACNASGDNPIQLVLVSHKPITQYVAKHGSERVNEWKKIEGRFRTIEMLPQASKAYEIIAHAVLQEGTDWELYQNTWSVEFNELIHKLQQTRLFSELNVEELERYVVKGTFPLHPVTVFALPRLTQKVAQNERTLFTFLTEKDMHALPAFLGKIDADTFKLLTLDTLYDYFSVQMQSLEEQEGIRQIWFQVQDAIGRLENSELLEVRILKTIGVIKAVGQPGVLPPTVEMLRLAFFGSGIDQTELVHALQVLHNKRILLEGLSSGHLEILQPGELDIPQELERVQAKRHALFSFLDVLNINFTYPPILAKEYNDRYAMTRYFSCQFVWAKNAVQQARKVLEEEIERDGIVYLVLPDGSNQHELCDQLRQGHLDRAIFLLPAQEKMSDVLILKDLLQRDDAIVSLLGELDTGRHNAADRFQLLLLQKELRKAIHGILERFFGYEKVTAYWQQETILVSGKSSLSRLVSRICQQCFFKTPRMNNEMINKHRITSPIIKARQKIVDGLLRPYLEPQLGLIGSGPEVAIYRSLLRYTGIVKDDGQPETEVVLSSMGEFEDQGMREVLREIQILVRNGGEQGVRFSDLLSRLCQPPFGVRKGIVPILLALFLHNRRNDVQLIDRSGSERMLSGESIELAMKDPMQYLLVEEDWTPEKRLFAQGLREIFYDYVDDSAELMSISRQLIDGMRRWFVSLPRLTRDTSNLSKDAKSLRRIVRNVMVSSAKLLFADLPHGFGIDELDSVKIQDLRNRIEAAKEELEGYQHALLAQIGSEFSKELRNWGALNTTALGAARHWFGQLTEGQRSYYYSDGTQEMLSLFESFSGEDDNSFLKQLLLSMTGVRVEDWSDTTRHGLGESFRSMLQEIENQRNVGAQSNVVGDIVLSYTTEDGNVIAKRFTKAEISASGALLQNVIKSYIRDFGDAITNHEKRYILAKVLEDLS